MSGGVVTFGTSAEFPHWLLYWIIVISLDNNTSNHMTRSRDKNFRAPDTAKIKAKMVYAGSKDALTRALVGVSTKISATDLSELTEDIITEACRKFA